MKAIAVGTAAGAAALALIGAPVAHADPTCSKVGLTYSGTPDGYVADMHRCGFASLKSDDALLATGHSICHQMRSLNAHGRPVGDITAAIVDATGWDYDTGGGFRHHHDDGPVP
jgi:hypothetical protein